MPSDPSPSDIRQARAFRKQSAYFERIGDSDTAQSLIEAADSLAPAEPADDEAHGVLA